MKVFTLYLRLIRSCVRFHKFGLEGEQPARNRGDFAAVSISARSSVSNSDRSLGDSVGGDWPSSEDFNWKFDFSIEELLGSLAEAQDPAPKFNRCAQSPSFRPPFFGYESTRTISPSGLFPAMRFIRRITHGG